MDFEDNFLGMAIYEFPYIISPPLPSWHTFGSEKKIKKKLSRMPISMSFKDSIEDYVRLKYSDILTGNSRLYKIFSNVDLRITFRYFQSEQLGHISGTCIIFMSTLSRSLYVSRFTQFLHNFTNWENESRFLTAI